MVGAFHAVLITRPTEYEMLVERHGTRGQAEFFLHERGLTLEDVDRSHCRQLDALRRVASAVPASWRRSYLDRSDLDRWVFDPDQIIVAVGQDGLVANVAKYLDGQPVVGVNPEPSRHDGQLVRHSPGMVQHLLDENSGVVASRLTERRALVQADVDDGRSLRALNEVYVGHVSHQSARYQLIDQAGRSEPQSSSGVLVGTGSGSTGWCQSIWRERQLPWTLPAPDSADLAWLVREAWPSSATGTSLTAGLLAPGESLSVRSSRDGLVLFGDGIEEDRVRLAWGQSVDVAVAETALLLV